MALLEPDELADGEDDATEGGSEEVDWFALSEREREIRGARQVLDYAVATMEIARGELSRWDQPALQIASVAHVDHHGRPALEGIVRTTSAYKPRCSCCPLLAGFHSLLRDFGPMTADPQRQQWPDPDEGGVDFRVRLDAGTGICVEVESLDLLDPHKDFTVVIEEVDATYPDALFARR